MLVPRYWQKGEIDSDSISMVLKDLYNTLKDWSTLSVDIIDGSYVIISEVKREGSLRTK